MNVNRIINNFFNAGSSSRYNKEWMEKHVDKEKGSTIVRTGKFGIGALSAFILGANFEVSTKLSLIHI